MTCKRFQAIGPQLIQNDDIVEVQVSFIAVLIRDNKYRISTVLRSISLFDGQFSQVRHVQTLFNSKKLSQVIQDAYVKTLTENSAPPKQLKTLKRKVGYTDEEVSKTRTKLNRMVIDEPTEKADELQEKESEPNDSSIINN